MDPTPGNFGGAGNAVPVVLIDDDADQLRLLEMFLQDAAHADAQGLNLEVRSFTDPADALADLPVEGPAAIICDYKLPGSSGLDWLPDFVSADVGPVILLTAAGDEHVAAQAFKSGACDYLIKSEVVAEPQLLYQAVIEALRRYRLERRVRELTRELKVANRKLEQKNERLEELTETAHRFVDDVAHEFRTPLTVIKEFASIMGDGIGGEVTESQQEYLGFINDASRDLAQMVDDLLDSSRLKIGALRVDRRICTVQEIVAAVRPILQSRAKVKGVELIEDLQPSDALFLADPHKTARALINLGTNAIKFSPESSTVRLWSKQMAEGSVQIGVSDQGPGLEPDEQQVIFDRFRQVGRTQARVKGFGLGLNIARELIWLNLGSMQLESEPGVGSTFSFTLPPARPGTILDWYFSRLDEQEVAPPSVAVLEARPEGAGESAEVLRQWMAATCYPMDLLLPGSDGASILAIGASTDPTAWAARLQASAAVSIEQGACGGPVQVPTIRRLGAWPLARARQAAVALILERVSEIKASA